MVLYLVALKFMEIELYEVIYILCSPCFVYKYFIYRVLIKNFIACYFPLDLFKSSKYEKTSMEIKQKSKNKNVYFHKLYIWFLNTILILRCTVVT